VISLKRQVREGGKDENGDEREKQRAKFDTGIIRNTIVAFLAPILILLPAAAAIGINWTDENFVTVIFATQILSFEIAAITFARNAKTTDGPRRSPLSPLPLYLITFAAPYLTAPSWPSQSIIILCCYPLFLRQYLVVRIEAILDQRIETQSSVIDASIFALLFSVALGAWTLVVTAIG
jgi:hypothetical protein